MAEGADGPENLVLRYLRSIDARLERVEDKQLEHDREFAHMRGSFAAMRGDLVRLEGDLAGQFGQRIKLEQRIERIERRLGLMDEGGGT